MSDEIGVGPDPVPSSPQSFDGRGPDLEALIEAAHRAASMEGRIAAVSLTLFPVALVTLLLAFDSNARAALGDGTGLPILAAAAVLTAAGARWLWKIARPPFAAFPQRRSILERQPHTARELSAILERAAGYADEGIEVTDALDHAAPDEASHPSRVLAMGLRVLLNPVADAQADDEASRPVQPAAGTDESNTSDAPDGQDEVPISAADEARTKLPDWLTSALQSGWTVGEPGWMDRDPVQTLHLVSERIRAELEVAAYSWPRRVRRAALMPFSVCILPAAALLSLLAFL